MMSWLRIDDDFARHPKLLGLSHKERWTWLSILCYCARYKTAGRLPENMREAIPEVTPALLDKAMQLGLLEKNGSGYIVHDWSEYNPKDPTAAIRQARRRQRQEYE